MPPALTCVESIFGPMVAFADDLITQHVIDFGAHTRVELAFFLNVVHAGDHVFDLGAHIGTYTIPLARKVGPMGRVAAVEAVDETFNVLAANVALNDLRDRVDLRRALVAPAAEYEKRTIPGNTGATFFIPTSKPLSNEVLTIDSLAAETFIPDALKIDLEGFDAWALTTSTVLANRRPIVYVEVSENQLARAGAAVSELSDLFRRLDYRLFRNVGDRNAAHDYFKPSELHDVGDGGGFFDLLAIPAHDPRIAALVECSSGFPTGAAKTAGLEFG
jgi:FkbM family methyltransferase